jgi:hypothetical protein
MEISSSFAISIIGNETQQPFTGTFKVKTLLTRLEQFRADQLRRDLLGPNPEAAMPQLIGEAFIHSQLKVRLLEAPDWFKNSNYGLELLDSNITPEIFEKCMAEVEKKKQEFKASAELAATGLKA